MTDNMRRALQNQGQSKRDSTERTRDAVKTGVSTAGSILTTLATIALLLA